jgi:hypothetical protein
MPVTGPLSHLDISAGYPAQIDCHRAAWFALMASLMNLALIAGQLQTASGAKLPFTGMSAPGSGTEVEFRDLQVSDDPGCVKTQKSKRDEE